MHIFIYLKSKHYEVKFNILVTSEMLVALNYLTLVIILHQRNLLCT